MSCRIHFIVYRCKARSLPLVPIGNCDGICNRSGSFQYKALSSSQHFETLNQNLIIKCINGSIMYSELIMPSGYCNDVDSTFS